MYNLKQHEIVLRLWWLIHTDICQAFTYLFFFGLNIWLAKIQFYRWYMYRFLLKIVNRVSPSASACVFAYVAFGPTSGEILIIVVWQEYNFSISWRIYSKLLIYISIIFSFTAVSFGWKKKSLNYQTLYWYVSADTISKTVQMQKSGINFKSRFALV